MCVVGSECRGAINGRGPRGGGEGAPEARAEGGQGAAPRTAALAGLTALGVLLAEHRARAACAVARRPA